MTTDSYPVDVQDLSMTWLLAARVGDEYARLTEKLATLCRDECSDPVHLSEIDFVLRKVRALVTLTVEVTADGAWAVDRLADPRLKSSTIPRRAVRRTA